MGSRPAGIPQLEYLFSRLICTSVPIGYIALLVILIIAGIKYLTSAGEPKAISQAHQTVTWGFLGVVFLAISWLILQLIQNFTGLEITKFTLSSLPGVQGFTGSCWASPPISPEPPKPPVIAQQTTKSTSSQYNQSPLTSAPAINPACPPADMKGMKRILFNQCTNITLPNLGLPSRVCMAEVKSSFILAGDYQESLDTENLLSPLPKTLEEIGYDSWDAATGYYSTYSGFNTILAELSNLPFPDGVLEKKIYYFNKSCTGTGGSGGNPGIIDFSSANIDAGFENGFLDYLESQIPPPKYEPLVSNLITFNGWQQGKLVRFFSSLYFYLKYPKNKVPLEDYEKVVAKLLEDQKDHIESTARNNQSNHPFSTIRSLYERDTGKNWYEEDYRKWAATHQDLIKRTEDTIKLIPFEKYLLTEKKLRTASMTLHGIRGKDVDYYEMTNLIDQ